MQYDRTMPDQEAPRRAPSGRSVRELLGVGLPLFAYRMRQRCGEQDGCAPMD
jgi:hypothetical protein